MPSILTINGGSSSIRFAQFTLSNARWQRDFDGKLDRLRDTDEAIHTLTERLSSRPDAVGHRLVHGLEQRDPVRVTPELLSTLKNFSAIDPEHLPREIEIIESVARHFPNVPQAACFDTAFHADMPKVARLLPIPHRLQGGGIERYGFHGLSYAYLMRELTRLDPKLASGRLVLAHLGSGASMAAVKAGRCLDTSMGFTPNAGLPMGTRSGDMDPGLMGYLCRAHELSSEALQKILSHESGLLGVSGSSADVRDLLKAEETDERARDALALFCYQAKKWIGAYAAVLGGIDGLIFAGGIGENAPQIRARICEGLSFLGIGIDADRNASHEPDIISVDNGQVTVRVMRTNEELVIALATAKVVGINGDWEV